MVIKCEILEDGEKVKNSLRLANIKIFALFILFLILKALFYKYDGTVTLKEGPKRVLIIIII